MIPRVLRIRALGSALVAALAIAPLASLAPAAHAATAAAPRATDHAIAAVGPIGITVADLDRSVDFYVNVLGFRKLAVHEIDGEAIEHLCGVFGARLRIARLALGDEAIELTEFLAPRGRPVPVDSRSNDRWFQHVAIIVSDMDKAYAHLRRHKVTHASSGPQRIPDWNTAAAGIRAFYFKDPDGHTLEVLWFPPGKGAAHWHRRDRLFLGIDHTAIVVSDTDASLAFYRDRLGFEVAGESENYGPEQERLNNVFGARLKITSLRAPAGPAIEFLEYLTPSDGRSLPADARANDLTHWQTRLVSARLDDVTRSLRDARAAFVSPGPVRLTDRSLGFSRGLLVRDPDGHVMEVVE